MLCLCFPYLLVHVPAAVSKYPTEATVLTHSLRAAICPQEEGWQQRVGVNSVTLNPVRKRDDDDPYFFPHAFSFCSVWDPLEQWSQPS